VIRKALDAHPHRAVHSVEDVLEVDREVRQRLAQDA